MSLFNNDITNYTMNNIYTWDLLRQRNKSALLWMLLVENYPF